MSSDLFSQKISFIGGGNMAAAIISGLISKNFSKSQITVSEPWEVNRQKMADLGVQTTTNNLEAATGANIIILAVKPQVAKAVCEELGSSDWTGAERPVLVSIAAGITRKSLAEWSTGKDGKALPIVRVMPNTPALLGEGASGLYAGDEVSETQRKQVDALLQSVSRATEWVEKEELLDVVTGLSGSGPAYFFAFVEHLIESATALGLGREQATRLAAQTCLGAGKMLVESSETPTQLRKNVTSPNGTTQAALETLEKEGLKEIVDKAVKAATSRSEELGKA
ncbi:unnamed protein product [Zymoseptoria tritici ST99CH_1A5]|nr:unnamed protein product [Zymoseptoria tritici ST99CH_1E4]SMR43650.1 unnamed protein product [Zymoseptoria tritici ST99CH_3D1]SMY18799.1 unnamed protein product [Zymoseptoria tritici ST99CH_1A5]